MQPDDKSTQQSEEIQHLKRQVAGLTTIIGEADVPVESEPTGDVAGGIFLAHIRAVSADASPRTMTLDIITDEMVPWATKRDRERSSWPDYFGHNKKRHLQSVRLTDESVLADGWGTGPPRIVSASEFATAWKTDPDKKDQKYYVRVDSHNDGHVLELSAAWPWQN